MYNVEPQKKIPAPTPEKKKKRHITKTPRPVLVADKWHHSHLSVWRHQWLSHSPVGASPSVKDWTFPDIKYLYLKVCVNVWFFTHFSPVTGGNVWIHQGVHKYVYIYVHYMHIYIHIHLYMYTYMFHSILSRISGGLNKKPSLNLQEVIVLGYPSCVKKNSKYLLYLTGLAK